jgi:hypothetical protein
MARPLFAIAIINDFSALLPLLLPSIFVQAPHPLLTLSPDFHGTDRPQGSRVLNHLPAQRAIDVRSAPCGNFSGCCLDLRAVKAESSPALQGAT